MYRVLKNRPTILDYIDTWGYVDCPCGRVADVCWHPDEFDALGQWEDDAWFAARCPSCVIDAAPQDLRSGLVDHYDDLRTERLRLGLGRVFPNHKLSPIDADEGTRESLRWYSDAITLHASTWRRPYEDGKHHPSDLYMVQLMIAGATAEHYPGRLDLDGIAPRPSFEVEPLEVPLLLEGSVEFVRVVLGATVHDLRRRGLKWQYGWNRSLPASMGFFSLPPDWEPYGYSPGVIGTFVSRAMKLYQTLDAGGRPRLVDPGCEWYFDQADSYVLERGTKTPTQAEFLEFTGMAKSTMRGHLEECHLWPWKKFRDRAFPSARSG